MKTRAIAAENRFKTVSINGLFLFLIMILWAGIAQGAPFTFSNITGNNAGDAAIGELQLSLEVEEGAAGQVTFTFSNSGPAASSITDIYFYGVYPFSSSQLSNSTGVSFSMGSNPPNLPGFDSTTTSLFFSTDSNPPTQPNGINPGEYLTITFTLLDGYTFNDLLAGMNSGDLIVGIHVQGFDSGGSESFVTNNPVPVPASFLLFGSGLIGLIGMRRKSVRS